MTTGREIVRMEKINKVYSNGVYANREVDFTLLEGEIHALVGENGAGKSTLMKILYGLEGADGGQVYIEGQPMTVKSPKEAMKAGIGMVHQHFKLIPSLTVAENLVLGDEPMNGMFVDLAKAESCCREISERYELPVDPKKKVSEISVSEKQKLEILKVLMRGAKIIIMDEPTAVLTSQEIEELFVQLKKLKSLGHTIIFISHHLNELVELCDRMTVMKDGKSMGVYEMEHVDIQQISNLMVGREVTLKVEKDPPKPGKPAVRMNHVCAKNRDGKDVLKDISFTIREGEIVGIAAVEGNGQTEVASALIRQMTLESGEIEIAGKNLKDMSYHELREKVLGFIPEDRIIVGTAQNSSIMDNLIALEYRKEQYNGKRGFGLRDLRTYARRLVRDYSIKCDSEQTTACMLSGGNMQKVVVAREIDRNPYFIIAQQPTRGIDVGSIEFIHKTLVKKRQEGAAILLISADLNEVISVSDSLLVMYNGEITAYFPTTEGLTEEEVGQYMLGVSRHEKKQIRRACHEEKED